MRLLLNQGHTASVAAWVFVVIWSTGFVIARGISGLIDPYLFLLVRFACVLLVFLLAMLITRSKFPTRKESIQLIGIGALMQGLYLGPGFWAVSQGLEAGVMALLGAIQPPLTALLAWHFLRESISRRTVIGLIIGIVGVSLAVSPNLSGTTELRSSSAWVIAAALLSISSITVGTVLQKSSILTVPLLSAITLQTLGAVLVMFFMAITLGQLSFPLTLTTAAYLSYAVFVLSIGGFTLLTWLVRTGSATRASSLLLLVPPLAATMSWVLYSERLSGVQISGFVLALLGVLLARS